VCVIACAIKGISKSGSNATIGNENFLFIYSPPRFCVPEFFKVFAKSSSEDEDSRMESLFKMRLLGCSSIREPLIIHYREVLNISHSKFNTHPSKDTYSSILLEFFFQYPCSSAYLE
jgi:hypothetical protein